MFIKHRYPFTAFGSSSSAGCRLGYYARRAGIAFPAGRSHGLHSLRGALAVAMLQADTPPPVVTAVLGHAAATTTAAHYLRLDTGHLRECARDVEDVLGAGQGARPSNATLPALIDTLVAARRACGFRYDKQERVLRQFAGHCRREGYADGSIVREAVEEFLDGRHLKASTVRSEEIVLRELAGHARQFGWQAWAPPPLPRVKAPHRPPPYVFSDDEVPPPVPRHRHPAAVGGVEQGAGRPGVVPGALLHRHAPVRGTRPGTARLRPGPRDPRGARREEPREPHLPVTARLAATLDTYITAAHPQPGPCCKLFHTGDPSRPPDKSTAYNRFRRYLADADIPHFPGGPHIHSLRHGFAVANLRRWASAGADLAVMLPYLSAYMGHADLRGTQYYLRLTADAYPEVAAMTAARFGYVIPGCPPGPQGPRR